MGSSFIKLVLFSILAFALFGCGDGKKKPSTSKPLKLSIKTLGENGNGFQTNALRSAFGELETTSATNGPIIDGLQITLRDSIVFCKGEYGTSSDCSFVIHSFEKDLKLDLTKNVNDQLDITTSTEIEAGTYSHASIRYKVQGEIKAYYINTDNKAVYTTKDRIEVSDTTSPKGDYDYFAMNPMYPWLSDMQGYQETTYFETPFVYDGVSEIDLKVHVDLLKAGKFVPPLQGSFTSSWTWKQDYLNVYMTFEETDAVVETYELTTYDNQSVSHPQILTLVFNSNGELVGGRTRGEGEIEQFIKNWNCNDQNICKFEIGDYGKGSVFLQRGENFSRISKGDSAKLRFDHIKEGMSKAVQYERIDR